MVEREPPPGSEYHQRSFLSDGLEIDPSLFPSPKQASADLQTRLGEVLAAYNLSPAQLRSLAAKGSDVREALQFGDAPEELVHLLSIYSALLTPRPREQVRGPADVVGLLMTEMSHLDQEELRTVLLDTKNYVQGVVTVYRGSLNASLVRIGELYKGAIRRNSAAIILAHNHPSGDPTPSPEDTLVTRQALEAGKLLDVDLLDHLVIGQGRWVSMRERGLGFSE